MEGNDAGRMDQGCAGGLAFRRDSGGRGIGRARPGRAAAVWPRRALLVAAILAAGCLAAGCGQSGTGNNAIGRLSGRCRSAAAGWHAQVNDAYAKGAALQDAMSAAQSATARSGADADVRWSDIQRRADDLSQTLYAMREAAPGEAARATVLDVLGSLQAARSAMDAERVPGGAGDGQAAVVRQRLAAFETPLRALPAPSDRSP